MTEQEYSEFSNRIRQRRLELGLTQTQFAYMLGTDQSAISEWETRHEPPNMRIKRAVVIAKILGIPFMELFGELIQ